MTKLRIPPVPDLARLHGGTVDEVISALLAYYDSPAAPFNYLPATRCVGAAYRGLHDLRQLAVGCEKGTNEQGAKSNKEVVEFAAPLAFGRNTQVFNLPSKRFAFGRDLSSGYRIPFFFVEQGLVKLYYLQPRKSFSLTYDQLCMVATIHKRYLLDTEFFGQSVDVEYVDVSAASPSKAREVHTYRLNDLELWPEKRLADRLTILAEAIEFVRTSDLLKPRRRVERPRASDMPLFD